MRPADFFELSAETQWAIDKSLGILDWDGVLTPEEQARFEAHYDYFKANPHGEAGEYRCPKCGAVADERCCEVFK